VNHSSGSAYTDRNSSKAGNPLRKKRIIYENRTYREAESRGSILQCQNPIAEVCTHDTKLKKRLLEYAAKFPELCQQTDDDEHGGLRFEIDKSRINIRLTAPYSEERRQIASKQGKETGNLIRKKVRENAS